MNMLDKNNLSGDAGLITWRANMLKPLIDKAAKKRRLTRSEWLAKVVKEAVERELGQQHA